MSMDRPQITNGQGGARRRRTFWEWADGVPRDDARLSLAPPLSAPVDPRTRDNARGGLVASARKVTGKSVSGSSTFKRTSQAWQEDAWEMYDLVGEQRFLAETLASRMSQARLYVGRMDSRDHVADPTPVTDQRLINLLETVGGSSAGLAQLIMRMGINMFVAGDLWLVGMPEELVNPENPEAGPNLANLPSVDELNLEDLEWRVMSVSELAFREKEVQIKLENDKGYDVPISSLYMIRVWKAHPRRSWEANSPTRASLPVLRELVGLTMHISAQIDSRLAGAGLLVIPSSAAQAMRRSLGIPDDSDEDPFTDALMEAMLKPIEDRSNASAVVPLVATVPDESAREFQHIKFSTPLDSQASALREEAIRRLALGQDAPPELLLGTGGMNHWGAWLVREDVVSTHIEPPLALICDALTTQFLHPVMEEMGFSEEEIDEHVIWFDTSAMIVRPNRASDAIALHDKGAISDRALREANGFDESSSPGADPDSSDPSSRPGERTAGEPDLAALKAVEIVQSMPALMQDPGLPEVVRQVRVAMYGEAAAARFDTGTGAPSVSRVERSADAEDSTTPGGTAAKPDPSRPRPGATTGSSGPAGTGRRSRTGPQSRTPRLQVPRQGAAAAPARAAAAATQALAAAADKRDLAYDPENEDHVARVHAMAAAIEDAGFDLPTDGEQQ